MINKLFPFKLIAALSLLTLVFLPAFSARAVDTRTINIAGLVVNSKDLSPVASAEIYDTYNHLLGTTDTKGFYHVTINYVKPGEMYFTLKIMKPGYQTLQQNEHWGNLGGETRKVMYFGLKAKGSDADSFNIFGDESGKGNDLSYNSVIANFSKVTKQRAFEYKLENAKAGNENVVVEIDGAPYLIDKTGWIKLNSTNDAIALNDQKVYPANKLNAALKRKDIKGMTPVEGKAYRFVVYTTKR